MAFRDISQNSSASSVEILVLGRNNNDINLLSENNDIAIKTIAGEQRITHSSYPRFNAVFRTIHSSKGLEADYVIILNLINGVHGFPNQIIDDPIVSLLQNNKEKYIYAEERRLFYVALTRTRNYTYLLSPMINESVFVTDIKELQMQNEVITLQANNTNTTSNTEHTTSQYCPICKTGILSIKETKNGKQFVGCSNYPKCNYAVWDVDAVRNNMRCPNCGNFLVKRKGKYGEFYGCMSYPRCKYTKKL